MVAAARPRLVVRAQQADHITGFQHRELASDRGVADTGVGTQRRQIEKPAGTSGAQPEEARERIQIAHVVQGAHVALDIGAQVAVQPRQRLGSARMLGYMPSNSI